MGFGVVRCLSRASKLAERTLGLGFWVFKGLRVWGFRSLGVLGFRV